jgi:SsrA-binding protein
MTVSGIKVVASNRKAQFEYFLLEHFEAGLSLQGSEIKSVRAGQVSLTEAYVQVDGREAWLIEAHIAPYNPASRFNHDPKRPRRLLLHKKEILDLWNSVRLKGVTIIPVKMVERSSIWLSQKGRSSTINVQQLPIVMRIVKLGVKTAKKGAILISNLIKVRFDLIIDVVVSLRRSAWS